MPLTLKTNGSSGANIITATWFNDFTNLLTGQMTDQEVTIRNNLVLQAIGGAPSAALTATPVAGTGMAVGTFVYTFTFVSPDGESIESPTASATTTSANANVSLTSVTVGPTGTTARNIYRTTVGGSQRKLVHVIANNTATSYTDNNADATLGANAPTAPSFGGAFVLKDQNGNVTYKMNSDGSVGSGGSSSLVVNGTTSGTATLWQPDRGTVKRLVVFMSNFKNGATTNGFTIPVPFTKFAQFVMGDIPGFKLKVGGSGGTLLTFNNATGFGTFSTATQTGEMGFGDILSAFDWMEFTTGNGSTHNGTIMFTGV